MWSEDPEEEDPEKEYAGDWGNLSAFTFCNPERSGALFSTVLKYRGRVAGRFLIFLDSGATHHIVCNSALLPDIRPAEKPKTVVTKAGVMRVDQKGRFPGVGKVYYHPTAVINVLSFGLIDSDKKNFDVTHVKGSHFLVTGRDVTRAKSVLPLIQTLGYPSRKDLKKC